MAETTILVTAGNGALGSQIATALAKSYGRRHHILLTARKPNDSSVKETSTKLEDFKADFSWETLDLSNFASVRLLLSSVRTKCAKGELPPLLGIVNCAAVSGSETGLLKTVDGFHNIYQTNVLSPTLLVLGLRKDDMVSTNGLVIDISSTTHNKGDPDYFTQGTLGKQAQDFTISDEIKMYGSSKLLILMVGYYMSRQLSETSRSPLQITSLDPGGMSGASRLWPGRPLLFGFVEQVLSLLGPFIRVFMKSAINHPSVPAKAISDLFAEPGSKKASFYILDDEKKSSDISMDEGLQNKAWKFVMDDLAKDSKNRDIVNRVFQ